MRIPGDYSRFDEPWRTMGPEMGAALAAAAGGAPGESPRTSHALTDTEGFSLKRLMQAMELRGMSMASLARNANISASTIWCWFHRRSKRPSRELVIRIAVPLQVTPAWLMGYGPDEI